MNWRRGLWRLWVATSVLWIGLWVWQRDVPCALGFNYFGAKWWCGSRFVAPPDGYLLDMPGDTFPLMFGIPVMVLALGWLARWLAAGFSRL